MRPPKYINAMPGGRYQIAIALLGLALLGLALLGLLLMSTSSLAQPSPAKVKPAPTIEETGLVASLSTNKILIESNFSGGSVTVFGAISGPQNPATTYDAVVTIRGPRGAVTVRNKQKWGPFWFNLDNRKYIGIPAYIAILSNRDIKQIAPAAVRDDLRIGINALIPQQVARRGANDPEFRAALRRLREEQELFLEDGEALKFISPRVFQASIRLPGEVPLGKYAVDVAVFADGGLEARKNLTFDVSKTDIEQTITSSARDHPLLYGLLICFMALLIGWIGSVIFRRD